MENVREKFSKTFEEYVELFKKRIDKQYEEYIKKVKEIEEYQFKLMRETQIERNHYITDYTLRPLKKEGIPYAILE